MRIGIFGDDSDPQCHAIARAASELGADNVLLRADAFENGVPISFVDGSAWYRGNCVDDLRGFYLRYIPAPYAPYLEKDDTLVLYADWFQRYMHSRERASFFVSWLLQLQHRGATLVNPPHAASVLQYKPFQLHVLRSLGAQVPRTLVSNDPARVREFRDELKDVIYKPVMGGALTEKLDEGALEKLEAITTSPVIFQERIQGDDLRIMLVGDQIVSSVAIDTPEQQLDFRGDDVYSSGGATYREVKLPDRVAEFCRRAARECGLVFAGIDIKHHRDDWVFLELNSSPIYLDVERKLGHPISAAIARYIVDHARQSS
jgi:glutathione synthase/RimK-type ligase-like ATP-grasp enzyme